MGGLQHPERKLGPIYLTSPSCRSGPPSISRWTKTPRPGYGQAPENLGSILQISCEAKSSILGVIFCRAIIARLGDGPRCHCLRGLENYWSLLKRGLKGTYVSVKTFHLFRYLDEQSFRFNNRATKENPMNDGDRFGLALSQIAGKRLTFAEVTGKVGAAEAS